MKKVMVVFALISAGLISHAEETVGEKAQATAKAVHREAKKALHKVQEATCTEGDVKCAAKKAGNKIEEAKDAAVDKASEVKNKIDTK